MEEKGTFYFFFSNRGRPFGRREDSRPNRPAVRFCQLGFPHGVPRLTLVRMAGISASVIGRLTARCGDHGQSSTTPCANSKSTASNFQFVSRVLKTEHRRVFGSLGCAISVPCRPSDKS